LRSKNRKILNERIGAITRLKPSAYWLAAINKAGVPCGPINDIDRGICGAADRSILVSHGRCITPVLGDNPCRGAADQPER